MFIFLFFELIQKVVLSLKNERKNQTRVDQLIHQGRTRTFFLFWGAEQSLFLDL